MAMRLFARLVLLLFVAAALANAQVILQGRVVDELGAPVAAVRVWAHQGAGPTAETYTSPAGEFQLTVPSPGEYLVSAEHPGYFVLQNQNIAIRKSSPEVTLVLSAQREVFQNVVVGDTPPTVDPAQTQHVENLSGTEINDIPYPASHSFANAMRLMPGVIQDSTGSLHFHGGAEYQTRYTLDGFDISDPIDGRLTTVLAVEGIRSVNLVSGRESAENGRGSAGTLAIQPDNGTDKFHFTFTNFIPGLDTRGGGIHLGGWTPRAGFSGPLLKGRAWFSDSFDGQYNRGFAYGLPKGQNTSPLWLAGNLFHAQINLTAANILYADFLSDFQHQSNYGLGALDPISTTRTQRSKEWLTAVKDSYAWGRNLFEAGFADQRVFYRAIPQGDAPYIIAPSGRGGNYFVNSRELGRRDQLFANLFPASIRFLGRHQLQAGGEGQRLDYTAQFQRTGFQVIGLAGLPLFSTSFTGSGNFERPNATLAWYINDHWQPAESLTVDIGLREDWDELVRQGALAPRIALAYSPFSNAKTKLSAGYAVIHDATNLALFSRPLDQQAITTPFSPQGTPEPPLITTFVPGYGLKMPRFDNWSAGAEHDFGHRLSAKFEWLRKRGRDGFVFASENTAPENTAPENTPAQIDIQPQLLGYGYGGTYHLTNLRRDSYDEAAVTVRQSLADQHEWLVSYVRSRAVSNAVLDPRIDQPLQVTGNFGPMPWDAPNRLMSWAYLPLWGKDWSWAYLLDYRTGFPFSITDQTGVVSGPVNSHRYPDNFDLDLYIERRFTFRGYRFAFRGGCNNITNHHNPTSVNNTIGSPQFLQLYGFEGRHFEFRIRVFGRQPS